MSATPLPERALPEGTRVVSDLHLDPAGDARCAGSAAWPDGLGPVQSLRFEPGRLTLNAPGWAEPQRAAFAERVRAAGFQAEAKDDQWVISRGDRS